MKLKVFTTADSKSGNRNQGVRSITVRRKTHSVAFSALLSRELNIQEGDTAYLAMDEDSKNGWYFAIGKFPDGYHLSVRKPKVVTQCVLRYFCCGEVAVKFLEANKSKDICACLVAEQPQEIDGAKWYKIITSKPLRSK